MNRGDQKSVSEKVNAFVTTDGRGENDAPTRARGGTGARERAENAARDLILSVSASPAKRTAENAAGGARASRAHVPYVHTVTHVRDGARGREIARAGARRRARSTAARRRRQFRALFA